MILRATAIWALDSSQADAVKSNNDPFRETAVLWEHEAKVSADITSRIPKRRELSFQHHTFGMVGGWGWVDIKVPNSPYAAKLPCVVQCCNTDNSVVSTPDYTLY